MGVKDTRTIKSVDCACQILMLLQERDGAGVTELAKELGYAKSAIHSQLSTLLENELVVKDDNTYRLSLRYLDMAEHVKGQVGNYDVIKNEIDSLAAETGEVAQFATEEHGRLVYVYKAKGQTAVETASSVGRREYLHSTALGKAILSQLPRERVDEIIDERGLPEKTEETVTTPEALYERLATARERGYAIDDEENIRGLRCIAAPVLDSNESVFGALSISGPYSRMTDERIEEELNGTISRSANVIEINSKFS